MRSRELQREINDRLNILEAFNGANSIIYYGKGAEITSNRQDEQEMTVLCLRILQAALVYVNTLMLQDVLAEERWTGILTPEGRRGLTPLFWHHVLPCGEVKLDMTGPDKWVSATDFQPLQHGRQGLGAVILPLALSVLLATDDVFPGAGDRQVCDERRWRRMCHRG